MRMILLSFLLGLPDALVLAADAPQRFARAIETEPRTRDELLAVPLDSDVYAVSDAALGDLRVLDTEGQEVGYVLRSVQTTSTRLVDRNWTAKSPALRPLDAGGLEITFSLDPADPVPDGLRLVTPLDNFEQHVAVSSSADGQTWQPLAEALLFDYTRYMDVRSDRVPLPKMEHRRLRIVVAQPTAEQESELLELTRRLQGEAEADRTERVRVERRPFRIDRVELWAKQAEQSVAAAQVVEYPLVGHHTTEDADSKSTQIEIEARRQPLTSFEITTADQNFSRRARVEVETQVGNTKRWQSLGEGQLTRFGFRAVQEEQLNVGFSRTRASRYRITIENRDSRPLKIAGVTAHGPVDEVVFLAAAGGQYRLAYGGGLPPASYDTAFLQTALSRQQQPLAGRLSADSEVLAVAPPATGEQLRLWFNDPRVLLPVIALLVIVLGWGLFRAAQRVDQISETPPPGDAA